MKAITRRDAIKQISGTLATALLANGCARDAETEAGTGDLIDGIEAEAKAYQPNPILFSDQKPVVSIAAIPSKRSKRDGIDFAVSEAIDLLGGMAAVTRDKERVLIKPNLVNPEASDTTAPEVIEALVRLMIRWKRVEPSTLNSYSASTAYIITLCEISPRPAKATYNGPPCQK